MLIPCSARDVVHVRHGVTRIASNVSDFFVFSLSARSHWADSIAIASCWMKKNAWIHLRPLSAYPSCPTHVRYHGENYSVLWYALEDGYCTRHQLHPRSVRLWHFLRNALGVCRLTVGPAGLALWLCHIWRHQRKILAWRREQGDHLWRYDNCMRDAAGRDHLCTEYEQRRASPLSV
jgi:hypothetical protein